MSYSDESLVRIEKIRKMRELGILPYFSRFPDRSSIADIRTKATETMRDVNEVIAKSMANTRISGRVILARSFGKILFMQIQDATGTIQVMFSRENCIIDTGKEKKTQLSEELTAYKFAEKMVDVGDFIGIEGELFKTHKGELTVFAQTFTFLAKAIRPLPEKFHGLKDEETIYRQRYLDLISNEESYQRFLLRSKFTKTLRDFYHENGFIEIETPILGSSASGAAAKPFITHHNDFDEDFYLHISPETSLKKATVGRFERVFEIARDFRNEGTDPSHLQEFTMVEHYAVYWNFEDNMRFVEQMFDYLFTKLGLDKTITIKDKE
jgi:lysyl-tRNA synthetase class 2